MDPAVWGRLTGEVEYLVNWDRAVRERRGTHGILRSLAPWWPRDTLLPRRNLRLGRLWDWSANAPPSGNIGYRASRQLDTLLAESKLVIGLVSAGRRILLYGLAQPNALSDGPPVAG